MLSQKSVNEDIWSLDIVDLFLHIKHKRTIYKNSLEVCIEETLHALTSYEYICTLRRASDQLSDI